MTTQDTNTRDIKTDVEINAPVEAVWAALTTAEELTNWFPLEARVEPGVGGKIWSSFGPEFAGECKIQIWEPNQHLAVAYPKLDHTAGDQPPEDPYAGALITTDYFLKSNGANTMLRLVHAGFDSSAEWDDLYDGTIRGWAHELRGLKHYLEHHRGRQRTVAHARANGDFTYEHAWNTLFSSAGLSPQQNINTLAANNSCALTTANGELLEGAVAYINPPKDFCARIANLDNAFLRMRIDRWQKPTPRSELNLFLSLFGQPQSKTDAIQQTWQEMLDKLFSS